MKPKISVIMSVYNGMPFLEDAVKSILNQTYRNFEFIIVDDGSTDESWSYLKSLKDKRVILVKNKRNIGLASSLNIALAHTRGDFIARMDADDICSPDRLIKQVGFLSKNNDYVMVGSQVLWVNKKNLPISGFQVPQKDQEIRRKLILRNQFNHPTVMFRNDIVQKIGAYRSFLNGIEDYDLWFRVLKAGKVLNLSDSLIRRRIHPQALSTKNHLRTEVLALIVRLINLPLYLGFVLSEAFKPSKQI